MKGTWEGRIFGGGQYAAWTAVALSGVGIGAAGLAPAMGTTAALSLALGGAGASAINTYVYNPNANFVEYAAGAALGGLNPTGEAISVGGGLVGAGLAGASGGNARTGYQIGSTVSGLLGAGVDDYFRAIGKLGGAASRTAAARHALAYSGASAGLGAAGAALGYHVGGADGALLGAQLGGAMAGFAVACFTAGTPLVVDFEGNSRPIEEIEEGDYVLARSEFDPAGPLELKRVEEKFVRTAVVLELVVRPVNARALAASTTASSYAHGEQPSAFDLAFAEFDQVDRDDSDVSAQSIKTTAEHPFFVPARSCGAFVPAGELRAGERLVSHDGQLIEITSVNSTDDITTVYNLRVADHHTYFVGGSAWGWDLWVHNASYPRLYRGRLIPDGTFKADPRLVVDMPFVGKGFQGTNAGGWLRDASHYWNEILRQHPEAFSEFNRRVLAGKVPGLTSPVNDKAFRSVFSQYDVTGLRGKSLVHHHIGGGGQAFAVPQPLHPGYGGIHNVEKSWGIWGGEDDIADLLQRFL